MEVNEDNTEEVNIKNSVEGEGDEQQDEAEGEWRITTTSGTGDHHHHHHIVTVMTSAEELEGGGGSTTATFVPVTFDTGGRGGPGEVRLIQVPISMLPPNFHFLHSAQAEEHHHHEEDSSAEQILGGAGATEEEEGSQGEHGPHLAVTLVATTAQSEDINEIKGIHNNSGLIHDGQQQQSEELMGEPENLFVEPIISKEPSSLPSLRSRRSRPIRKHAYGPLQGSVRKKDDNNKPFTVGVTSEDETKGTGKSLVGGPKWPEDKCANCAVEFKKDGSPEEGNVQNQNVTVKKSSHLKIHEEGEDEVEVLNHEALQYVFNIKLGKGKEMSQANPDETSYCWLCGDCSKVLEELYVACRAFTKLTKEEAFLYKRLRTKVIQAHQQKQKTTEVPSSSFPGNTATTDDLGEKIEVKVELHEFGGEDDPDEDEEEWITGDLSDDEDFRASPTDLEKADISSDSSDSEAADQYHTHGSNKRKSKSSDLMGSVISPKKKRSSKNNYSKTRGGDSFWWDSNNKTDSDDSNLGFYTKRNKKLRVKKSLLAGITYDCSACETGSGASFTTPRELKVHLRECHREIGAVTELEAAEGNLIPTEDGSQSTEVKATATSCRLCSFEVFPSVQEFKTHWAKEHGEDKISSSEVLPYECFTCKKTFVEWTALLKHRVTHNLQKPYKCRLCGESWRRADELQVHWSRTHAQDFMTDSNNSANAAASDGSSSRKDESLPPKRREAVPCSVCGKAFMRHDHLKLHMRIHTGEKPFPCPTCGKAFSDPRGLAYHEVTHSSERPYCCTVCGMTFKRLHHLNDHERNHATNVARPFSCELCGKAFKYKKHLNSHSVIHGNSKDHSCEICHKAFNRKDNLRQHVKKVHGKEPGPDTMSSGSGGGSNVVHHSLVVSSLERVDDEDDVLVGEEPEVSISEEGTVRSGHVEVPTATAIPIVTGNAGEGLAVDHIVYMTL